jgi:hypothetical protein
MPKAIGSKSMAAQVKPSDGSGFSFATFDYDTETFYLNPAFGDEGIFTITLILQDKIFPFLFSTYIWTVTIIKAKPEDIPTPDFNATE